MCPTPLGRVHTRCATIVLPAILGLILSLLSGRPDWLVLVGVLLLLGVALDAGVYSLLLKYQPPWMTFVLALTELGLLYVLAGVLKLDLSPVEAIGFYWVCWVLAIATKICVLPIVSLTYLESAAEFRRSEWSIPASQAEIPFAAAAEPIGEATASGTLLDRASSIETKLEPLPSPSGVHRRSALAAKRGDRG